LEAVEIPKAAFASGPALPPEAVSVISVSDLVVGEYVFTVAQGADDQNLSAARVQVSKDGVKPPL